ncbi:MAG: polysaccharide biosynthesis tyrosine autokinase [Thermodesulfobacteriota bacterium]
MPTELQNSPEFLQVFHPRHHTFQDYLRILWKRRWAVLAVLITLVSLSTLYSFTATPIYKATVQILIERHLPRMLGAMDRQAPEAKSEEFYQTQYKLLESPALAKKVMEKLNLKKHPYYAEIFRELPPKADAVALRQAEERLAKAILGNIKVQPIRQSSLVDVSFFSPDPRFAGKIVNNLAQSYIELSMDLRLAASQESAQWLSQKIAEARKKLEDSEAKLNQYKKEQNIVTLEDKETITTQKLEQLNRELVAAQTRRLEAETRFKEVSQGEAIREVLNNPLIQTLKGEEAKIIAQISELGKKYGDKHPRMIQLHHELAAVRGKIGAEMGHVTQSIKNEYHMALAQEANLKKAMESIKLETQDMSVRGVQYRVLLRDVETNRALYENMLKSLKETTASENLPATNIRIVNPAAIPEKPDKPRKLRNLALSMVLGLVLGVTLALILENLDTTLKTPEEVEHWLEIPNLAMIPHLEFFPDSKPEEIPELVVQNGRQPLAAEAYRGLRTSILFTSPGRSPRILLVTSSFPLEGKSITAANLAAVMAKTEAKTLLVDADLRRPSQNELFRVAPEPGLSNFLVGEIDELPLVETTVPQLFLVPCGRIPPNPSELLHSERMQEFLTRAQEQFGRVIVDSPPLLSVTDPVILAALAEGVLLVIRTETVPRKAALSARNNLLEVKAPLLGVLLNDVPLHRDSYYYSHYSHYHGYYYPEEDSDPDKRPPSRHVPGVSRLLNWLKKKRDGISMPLSRKQ